MSEIICPSCDKTFKVDNVSYSEIVKQVRDREFEKQINQQKEQEEKIKNSEIASVEAKATIKNHEQKEKLEKEITTLKNDLKNKDMATRLAISDAISPVEKQKEKLEKEIVLMQNTLANKDLEQDNLKKSLESEYLQNLQNKDVIIKYKDEEITRVKDMKQKFILPQ